MDLPKATCSKCKKEKFLYEMCYRRANMSKRSNKCQECNSRNNKNKELEKLRKKVW